MTPFLTYELLTPETADPVVIRITGQRERGFPDFRASNGEKIVSRDLPYYGHYCHTLWTHGKMQGYDGTSVEIPLSDWPAVKQAIGELNEHYKEKDMDMKRIDEYNKMVRDIAALVEPVGYDLLVNPDATLTVTRKKPKVEDRYREVVEGLMATYDWVSHKHKQNIQKALALLEDLMAENKANGGKG